jgi:hypothetical protein
MRKPCPKCPFRTDVHPYLRPERATQIARALRGGESFDCHNTVTYEDAEEGTTEAVHTGRELHCAGALIICEKEGHAPQMIRIAERLGMYDRTQLDMDSPVYPTLTAWVASYQPEPEIDDEPEGEFCSASGPGCENPAGWLDYDGGVMENPDGPTCDTSCEECRDAVCDACSTVGADGRVVCPSCADEEE